jgi:hypothetical protein
VGEGAAAALGRAEEGRTACFEGRFFAAGFLGLADDLGARDSAVFALGFAMSFLLERQMAAGT